MNKLEKIEQGLKTNVNTFIDNTIEKCQGCVEVKDFTYSICILIIYIMPLTSELRCEKV